MSKKVWHVKYVVGNPLMFERITTAAGGPFARKVALDGFANICQEWRCWVEHVSTGERIAETDVEKAWLNGEIEEV